MDGSASIGLEQALLGHSLGFAPMASPTQVYVALCLAAQPPSETVRGLEASGGGYVRTPATFALIAGPSNIAANTTSVEFQQAASSWGVVGFFELWDAASGGNRLYWGQLVDPADFTTPLTITVSAGDIVRFSAGTLGVQAATGSGGTASIGAYLPLAGGTLTGPVYLAGDPTDTLQAATKGYVDAHSGSGGGPGFLPLSGGTMLGPLNYTATGGTTSRSAQDRAHDWINVTDFGAVLNGTTNDTAAWAAARAAATDYGTITVPRGRQFVNTAPTGGPATPVLWRYDGNYVGSSGTTPVVGMGTDIVESFVGSKYFARSNTATGFLAPVVRIDSTVNHTGGVAHNTVTALRINATPTSSAAEDTLGVAAVITSTKPSGGNLVAVTGYSVVSPTGRNHAAFGGNISATDNTGLKSSASGISSIGAEFDVLANDDDDAGAGSADVPANQGTRVVVDVVGAKAVAGGTDAVIGWGVRVGPSSDLSGVSFRRNYAAYGPFLKSAFSTEFAVQQAGANAIWLGDGHTIALNKSGANTLGYTTTGTPRLRYMAGTTEALSISDAGTTTVGGMLTFGDVTTNQITVTPGATPATAAVIRALGTGDLILRGHGAGASITIQPGTNTNIATFVDTANGANSNYVSIRNAAAGGVPAVRTFGPDASVNLNLQPQGVAGIVNVVANGLQVNHTLAGIAPVNGFINGTLFNTPTDSVVQAGTTGTNWVSIQGNVGALPWQASTAVTVGLTRNNGGNIYTCTTAGTTAASGGPAGTGTGIADGTAVWSYAQSDHVGIRSGLNVGMSVRSPAGPTATAQQRQWPAITSTFAASANVGGTGLLPGNAIGLGYAGGDQSWLLAGATNWQAIVGREIDVGIFTGASAKSRYGLSIVSYGQINGALEDNAVSIGSNGIPFLDVVRLGEAAISAGTRSLLSYIPRPQGSLAGLTYTNPTTVNGIDLANILVTGIAFRAPGNGGIDGTGAVFSGAAKLSTSAAAVALDAVGSLITAIPTIDGGAPAPSGFKVGDQLYDASGYGCILTVNTIDGSGKPLTWTITQAGGTLGATPANPVTFSGGSGINSRFNLTWTQVPTLALNPSGGPVTVRGVPIMAQQALYATYTNVGNGADTTLDTLQTFTMAAGQLKNVGDRLVIRAGGNFAASTDSKSAQLRMGAGALLTVTAAAVGQLSWRIEGEVCKTGPNAQTVCAYGVSSGNISSGNTATSAQPDASAITLLIAGQNTTNPVASSITCRYFTVDYVAA